MSYPSMTRRKGEGWEASLSQSSSRPVSSQVCRHLEHRHVLLRVCEQRVEREGLHSGLHDGRGGGGEGVGRLGHHAVLEVGYEVVEGEVGVFLRRLKRAEQQQIAGTCSPRAPPHAADGVGTWWYASWFACA